MKLLIQLHFQNGLGNLYTAVVQLLHFANYYKKLGYKCNFIFASKNTHGKNGWGLDKINIEEIFDMDAFDVFDTVTNVEFSIMDKEYIGYTFYGGGSPSGVWWDVFFSENVDNFYQLSYGNHDGHIFSNRDFIPEKIPQFNKKIIDRVKNYLMNLFQKAYEYLKSGVHNIAEFFELQPEVQFNNNIDFTEL